MTEPKLTYQARALLRIIRGAGGEWVTRGDMAKHQDKTRLNVWDVTLLGKLTEYGLIETSKRTVPGPIGYEYLYRAIEKGD